MLYNLGQDKPTVLVLKERKQAILGTQQQGSLKAYSLLQYHSADVFFILPHLQKNSSSHTRVLSVLLSLSFCESSSS